MAFSGVQRMNEIEEIDEIDDIIHEMNYMYMENVENKRTDLIAYISSLINVEQEIKTMLINLVKNDSYESYIDIYNICQENDIELPPLY
jgi:predicted RNA-binding protein with EMAP domain